MNDSMLKSAVVGRVATVLCLSGFAFLSKYGYVLPEQLQGETIELVKQAMLLYGTGTVLWSKMKSVKNAKKES